MLNWDAETLWLALEPLAPGLSIEVLPQCGSTNTVLLERARAAGDAAYPCLLVTEQQTAGRGRLGRQWWSEPGGALMFSLSLPYAPADWSGLSLAVGLAVAEALDEAGTLIGLKWPNDLWLRHEDRKLGGILIETTALAAPATPNARLAVIGIGLNIAPQAPAGGSYNTGYAGLQAVDPRWDAPTVLARVAPALLRMLNRFEATGMAPLTPAFAARDVLAGREVRAGAEQGRAAGIDASGNLLLQTAAGELQAVFSGEVSVRPC
jgi:BirA family biotin operon repressor/biotin-[acetyl-CoA-carboxylase] ligase